MMYSQELDYYFKQKEDSKKEKTASAGTNSQQIDGLIQFASKLEQEVLPG